MTFAITRLSDPKNVASSPRQLKDLNEKISSTMTRLLRKSPNGGNPFLFALAGPKPHILSKSIDTAATDGKKFYWNPDWLEQMDADQVATIMSHESFHVLFFHCSPERAGGLNPQIWNIAVDYVVNGVIIHDHEKSGRSAKQPKIFYGSLGTPISLQQYIEWIDGKRDSLPEPGCFADETLHGRSPESIYDQIQKAWYNSPRRCKESTGGCGAMSMDPKTGISTLGPGPYDPECCQQCGAKPNQNFGPGSLDSHLSSQQTKDETLSDMLRAAEQAEAMSDSKDHHQNVPGEIQDLIRKMGSPELTANQILRGIFSQKKIDAGNINDHKRYRRRPSYIYEKNSSTGEYEPKHRIYMPKKYDKQAKWLALLDTSGSMSNGDMASGFKELQVLLNEATGYVVAGDVGVDWGRMKKVTKQSDLDAFEIVGGGGTEPIEPFLKEYQKYVPDPDVLIFMTDGWIPDVNPDLKPNCEFVVVLTDPKLNIDEFRKRLPFGRVCRLKRNSV